MNKLQILVQVIALIYSETIFDLKGGLTENSLKGWTISNWNATRSGKSNVTVCGSDPVENSIMGGDQTFGQSASAMKIQTFTQIHSLVTLNITVYAIGSLNTIQDSASHHDDNFTITVDDALIQSERVFPQACMPRPKSYFYRCGDKSDKYEGDVWNISITFPHSNNSLKLFISSTIDEPNEYYGWRDIAISSWECTNDCSPYGRQNITDQIMKPYVYGATCTYSGATSCNPDQFYRQGTYCFPCNFKCKKCSSSSNCLECEIGYKVLDGFCSLSCPFEQYYQNSTSNICVRCLSNCKQCTNTTNCIACIAEFGQQSSNCYKPCPEGMYFDNGQCLNCSSHCGKCISQYECMQCDDGQYKKNHYCQSCFKPCKKCTTEFDCQ